MSEPATILTVADECRYVFRSATKHVRLMQEEWAENRLADFNLWAGGAGVFARGKASLDRRLGADPVAKSIVVNLLMMLRVLMEDCIIQASNMRETPRKDALELSREELDRMRDVDNNLNQLTRLTVAIRKAGNMSRLEKADTTFDPHSASLRALRQHLEILLWVRPEEHGTSSSSLQYINEQSLTPIQLRLIDANLRRRNRFLYAQKHALKLAARPTNREETRPLPMVVTPTLPPPLSYRSRENTTISNSQADWTFPEDFQAQSTTTATRLDEPITLPPPVVTRAASTAVSVTSSRISYPGPPPIHDHQRVFRCPCCCQSLPTTTGKGNQWKKHLMMDILPYTCIIDDCPQPHIFYLSKDSWLQHMDKEHGGTWQWVCHACSQKNIHVAFKEQESFTAHLKVQHSRGIRSTQVPTLLTAWRRRVPLRIPSCPICEFKNEDHTVVLDHTAEHIHAFSLRSLPWAPDQGGESPGIDEEFHDGRSYFNNNPYFDVDSRQSTLSSDSDGESSWARDLEGSPALGFEQSLGNQGHLLTEDVVQMLPQDTSDRENARRWLIGLNEESISQTSIPSVENPALTAAEGKDDQLWYPNNQGSREPALRLNEYFIPGDDISREAIYADIQRYLGPDALVRSGTYEGQSGYFIRAYRNLTSSMIEDLKLDSAAWVAECKRRSKTTYSRNSENAITSHHS